jgi:hypothetical protein
MAPFRPTNINKRSYPGNGSVVGVTTAPYCTLDSSCTVYECHPFCDPVQCYPMTLGCCKSCCAQLCCNCYCSCTSTDYSAFVPAGMYKLTEQKTAVENNSWVDTTVCGPASFIDVRDNGVTNVTNELDCCGWYFCCSGTQKYFATGGYPKSGYSYGASYTWNDQGDEVTRSVTCFGFSGQWHNPDQAEGLGSWDCRTYWTGQMLGMWTCELDTSGTAGCNINWCTGTTGAYNKGATYRRSRAFRCA